ncbi:MAG: flavodoxin-dependent (E)-4-hydroxy-3-methylbut-2-enyl-diphosphate synthase, partial [Muribaculaceae bacterium]|nr:flavodoxin-dependent (E)-4-hydroxy-3-methylbut-2-enyl-diphosphate synthase [Muribaculaceae bacterium]
MVTKDIFNYRRRASTEARVGRTAIGGDNPIRLQSMTNTVTTDARASAEQVARIAEAGADLVRLTTQGEREAAALESVKELLPEKWKDIPLVADVHFNPKAAFRAAETCEKVRINPGNFADPPHQFKKIDYTDEEYAAELRSLRDKLVPFLEKCRLNGVA